MKSIIIIFILILKINSINSQQLYFENSKDDSLLISINQLTKDEHNSTLIFDLRIMNLGKKNIFLPDKIISGVWGSGQCNLSYEFLYCGKDIEKISDSIISNEIGPPVTLDYKLSYLEVRSEQIYVPRFYFSRNGFYLIRFILQKKFGLFKEIKEIKANVSSNWFVFEMR